MTKLYPSFARAFILATAFWGGSMTTCAADANTEGFDTFKTSYADTVKVLNLPEDWYSYGDATLFTRNDDAFYSKRPSIMVEGANTGCYLITPELQGDFTFFLRNRTKNYQASVKAYACTYSDGAMTLGTEIGARTLARTTSGIPAWESVTFTAPNATRIALLLSDAIFDDFTYTRFEAADAATLVVSGYASGSTYDFGTVEEGTAHTFALQNIGLTELTISSIAVTGGFTIAEGGSLTSIAPLGNAAVTVSTPAADAEGTLTITSNDAHSPYSISLKSCYKVPEPVMHIDLTAVVFGNVTDDASQDITVSNTGDAVLTAAVSSDNDDFTVSPASLTVPAGDSKTFTITYHYQAAAYGGHTATITVMPNAGQAVTISASASVKDPNAWSEDFSGNVLPAGWTVIGSGWTFADGEAIGTYERNGYLVTPKLNVQAGQALTFEARSRQYGTDIIVQCQKDEGAWETKLSEARNTQTEFETYTIGGLKEGVYRLRIATENVALDNFEGFCLADGNIVQEKWWVGYAFHYMDGNGKELVEQDTEQIDVVFDGDDVSFHFPNPINGNAWMGGTRYSGEGPACYVFPNGQLIGQYGGENAYFCGSNGNALTDMVFYYDEEAKEFHNFEHILINSSTTAVSYWGYFSDVIVSKEKPDLSAIADARMQEEGINGVLYDLQGRRIADSSLHGPRSSHKPGLYIIRSAKGRLQGKKGKIHFNIN